jgi:hypothetical protein
MNMNRFCRGRPVRKSAMSMNAVPATNPRIPTIILVSMRVGFNENKISDGWRGGARLRVEDEIS